MSNPVARFFKSLGHLLGGLLSHLSDEHIHVALSFVQMAAQRQIDNAQRREFAVSRTQAALHVPESTARWLVETAVQLAKGGVDKGLVKLEEKLIALDPPPALPPAPEGILVPATDAAGDADPGLPSL